MNKSSSGDAFSIEDRQEGDRAGELERVKVALREAEPHWWRFWGSRVEFKALSDKGVLVLAAPSRFVRDYVARDVQWIRDHCQKAGERVADVKVL